MFSLSNVQTFRVRRGDGCLYVLVLHKMERTCFCNFGWVSMIVVCACFTSYCMSFFFTEGRSVTICSSGGSSNRNVYTFLFEGDSTSVRVGRTLLYSQGFHLSLHFVFFSECKKKEKQVVLFNMHQMLICCFLLQRGKNV